MLVFTAVVVFDSTIVDFSSYSGVEASISVNTAIFIILSIIFAASSTTLLNSVRKSTYTSKSSSSLRYFRWIITGVLILTVIIILAIILQMVLLNEYSLILLKLQTYVSHVSAMVFLSLLVFLFAKWFTSKKTFPIILYTISLSLVSLNLLMSLLYLHTYLSAAELPIVEPFSIHSYVTNFSGVSNNLANALIGESLSMIFDVLSLSSFILMWIATAILLSQYRYKMGRIKYFSLMSIPLLYYIFPFQNYFGDAFLSMIESSPVSFSIIYILSFSA